MTVASRALPLFAGGVLLAAHLAGPRTACAQTATQHSLSVSSEAEFDSNPRMAVGNAPSTTWLRVRPTFAARRVLGADEYRLDAAVSAEKSTNPEVAKDRVDPRLRGLWKRSNERGASELSVLWERRALRSLDVAEPVPTGSDGARTLLSVGGSWSRELDERTGIAADLRQEWERLSGSGAPGFRRTLASARGTLQQSALRTWYFAANGQRLHARAFNPPAAGAERDDGRSSVLGAVLGVQQQFGPALRVDANAGVLQFMPGTRRDWQSTLRADYTGDRWTAGLELSRTPGVGSGFDALVVATTVRAHARYALAETAHLDLQAARSRDRGTPTARTLASVALVRQLGPAWELSLRASRIEHHGFAGTARANLLAVVLAYSAPDL